MIIQTEQPDTNQLALRQTTALPETGFIRLKNILGDKKAKPPIPAIIPVCPATFWKKVKKKEYPQPVKLSANITAWRVEDIRDLIERISSEGAA